MRVVMFYHSLVSDWNHGNAHFLRGVVSELIERGHDVAVYEPEDGWSRQHLVEEQGAAAIARFREAFPGLASTAYRLDSLHVESVLEGASLVLVHEWNDPALVRRIGEHRLRQGGFALLFHDTHHRSVTDPAAMAAYDLTHYDGVLAFGAVIRELYLAHGWARRAWTWHEAADVRRFQPMRGERCDGDLVWIGNWGDQERSAELREFLVGPVRALGLQARVYGVRYPEEARRMLAHAGLEYAGWLPNADVPVVLGRFRATVHIPRRPYAEALPGIPTIRVFEALACGIPLVSAPWDDAEALFMPGEDYLVAKDGRAMAGLLRDLIVDPDAARRLAEHGRRTVLARHTCAHRVDELLGIAAELNAPATAQKAAV
jgi:spore maturation protein CgeB